MLVQQRRDRPRSSLKIEYFLVGHIKLSTLDMRGFVLAARPRAFGNGHQIAIRQIDMRFIPACGNQSAAFDNRLRTIHHAFQETMRDGLDENSAPPSAFLEIERIALPNPVVGPCLKIKAIVEIDELRDLGVKIVEAVELRTAHPKRPIAAPSHDGFA